MVNKRMKPAKVLQLARRAARAHDLIVEELPGRGKGSHHIYRLRDENGTEVGRFAVTGHNRELSWTVLRSVESALSTLLGEEWLEEK